MNIRCGIRKSPTSLPNLSGDIDRTGLRKSDFWAAGFLIVLKALSDDDFC